MTNSLKQSLARPIHFSRHGHNAFGAGTRPYGRPVKIAGRRPSLMVESCNQQPKLPAMAEGIKVLRQTVVVSAATAAGTAALAAIEVAAGVPTCCIVPTMLGHIETLSATVGAPLANLVIGVPLPNQLHLATRLWSAEGRGSPPQRPEAVDNGTCEACGCNTSRQGKKQPPAS